ncbi:hypothetical protein BA6E_12528 [Bacteroidales bacterium 6E]|nr:hypothetical protein BA6E_12528 [Bacteroidales bacterium 6E]
MTDENSNLRYQCRMQEKQISKLTERVKVLEIMQDQDKTELDVLRYVVSKLTGKWKPLQRVEEVNKLASDYKPDWKEKINLF